MNSKWASYTRWKHTSWKHTVRWRKNPRLNKRIYRNKRISVSVDAVYFIFKWFSHCQAKTLVIRIKQIKHFKIFFLPKFDIPFLGVLGIAFFLTFLGGKGFNLRGTDIYIALSCYFPCKKFNKYLSKVLLEWIMPLQFVNIV